MSHGTEHHLEEAEHAQHHAADPFAARVAMTMAIIAAGLACVTMLSHRSHNETLAYRLEASDQWGYYQAKKNRGYMYDALADLRGELATDTNKVLQEIAELKAKQELDSPNDEESAEASPAGRDKPEKGESGKDKAKSPQEKWRSKAQDYEKEGEQIKEKAEALQHKSEHAHHMSALFDLGELGIELALVFCSLAVLTKRKNFWHSGLIIGAVGFGVAMLAFTPFGVSMIGQVFR
jgi:hypothetical protein